VDLSPNYEVRDLGFSLRSPRIALIAIQEELNRYGAEKETGSIRTLPCWNWQSSCENCHGPGELHLNEGWRENRFREGSTVDRESGQLSPWLADNIA